MWPNLQQHTGTLRSFRERSVNSLWRRIRSWPCARDSDLSSTCLMVEDIEMICCAVALLKQSHNIQFKKNPKQTWIQPLFSPACLSATCISTRTSRRNSENQCSCAVCHHVTMWLVQIGWDMRNNIPADTRHKNNVIMTSKRCCFDVIMTLFLRHVPLWRPSEYKGKFCKQSASTNLGIITKLDDHRPKCILGHTYAVQYIVPSRYVFSWVIGFRGQLFWRLFSRTRQNLAADACL